MTGVKVKIKIDVHDKNGKLISTKTTLSRSLVSNFLRWLRQWMSITAVSGYAGSYTMIDTNNANRTFPAGTTGAQGKWGAMGSPAGSTTVGIVFGRDNTSVTPDDHALILLIANGTGENQFTHDAATLGAVTINGQISAFSFARTAHNQSAATITVLEIGIYLSLVDSSGAAQVVMIARDVLTTPKNVNVGASITATYIVSAEA